MINPDDIKPQFFECTVFERWYTIDDEDGDEHMCRSFIAAAHGYRSLYNEGQTNQEARDGLREQIVDSLEYEPATPDPLDVHCAELVTVMDRVPAAELAELPTRCLDEIRSHAGRAVPRSLGDILHGAGFGWVWTEYEHLTGVDFARPVAHYAFTLTPTPSSETPSGYRWGTP